MKKLFIYGLISISAVSCGDDKVEKRTTSKPVALTNEEVAPIYQPRIGTNVDIPASYTFLDTPDANLCVDAFLRKGITLPPETVARTLDATSIKSEGIAISDLETSTIPILNVVHLRQDCSNVMFQFYNRNGFYCIVKNTSDFSNVRIQRSCSARLTEIEPIHHESHRSTLNLFWPIFKKQTPARDPDATQGAYNSRITELPCIP